MNSVPVTPTPEARQALDSVQIAENRASALKIVTPHDYQHAGDELKWVKGVRNRVEEARKTMTKPLDTAKAAIMDFFRAPLDRLDDIERKIKQAIVTYDTEQEEIRRREQREADERARKEREFNERRAARAAEQGRLDDAAEHQQAAAAVTAPVIVREAPKVSGMSMREDWKFEVTDPKLVPREYLMVDESAIRRVVKALKGRASIPGVRTWPEKIVASGSR